MNLSDSCKCGAKFSVSTDIVFGSSVTADLEGRRQHTGWLEAHAGCRSPLDVETIVRALHRYRRETGSRGVWLA